MADETQQTQVPVVGAEIKEDAVKAPFVYYFSDPDATDPMLHHLEIPSFYDLTKSVDGLPWHWHTEKPDESLKDAIWSNEVNGWVENNKNAQSAMIAQLQKATQNLDEKSKDYDAKNAEFDKAMQAMKDTQEAAIKQSMMVTKQMGTFSKQSDNTMKVMLQMQQTLQVLVKDKNTNPAPIQPVQPTANTDTTNNGGNK